MSSQQYRFNPQSSGRGFYLGNMLDTKKVKLKKAHESILPRLSIIMGLLGICASGIPAVAGILTGLFALFMSSIKPLEYKGFGKALAGVGISIAAILMRMGLGGSI